MGLALAQVQGVRRGGGTWWCEPFPSLRPPPSTQYPHLGGWQLHPSSLQGTSQSWVSFQMHLFFSHAICQQMHPECCPCLTLPGALLLSSSLPGPLHTPLSAQNHDGSHRLQSPSQNPVVASRPAVIWPHLLALCPGSLHCPDPQAPLRAFVPLAPSAWNALLQDVPVSPTPSPHWPPVTIATCPSLSTQLLIHLACDV